MHKPTVEQLATEAKLKQDRADRAFRRFMRGEVSSSTAARRLQNQADEAWRQLTSHPDYSASEHC